MPNLKFLASPVPEKWRGSHNFKSRSRDPFTTHYDLILLFTITPPVINLFMKFGENIFIGVRWQFYYFVNLASKICLIPQIFGSFWEGI